VLSVRDNGPGFRTESVSGVGLANIRTRLQTLFGDEGQLEVVRVDAGGTIATIRLPFRRVD